MTQEHEIIREKLFALYDGPLTEKERKLVEGHLTQCADCRRALAEWKALSRKLLPRLAFSEASEDFFVLGVMNKLEPYRPVPSWFSDRFLLRWGLPLMGAAALAVWFTVSSVSSNAGYAEEPAEAAFTYAGAGGGSYSSGIVPVSYPGP